MVATNPIAQERPCPTSPPKAGLYGDAQRTYFRQVLQDWKQSLLDEVSRTVNHMRDGVFRVSRSQRPRHSGREFSLELRTRDRETQTAQENQIEALAQIESGDYGYLRGLRCGDQACHALQARPTTHDRLQDAGRNHASKGLAARHRSVGLALHSCGGCLATGSPSR